MSIVALKLPDVKRKWEERSQQCIYCAGELFQRWGQVNKRVKDVRVRNVKVDRYRCCDCKRTFRHYPESLLCFPIRTQGPLDQQLDRTSHWSHENAG